MESCSAHFIRFLLFVLAGSFGLTSCISDAKAQSKIMQSANRKISPVLQNKSQKFWNISAKRTFLLIVSDTLAFDTFCKANADSLAVRYFYPTTSAYFILTSPTFFQSSISTEPWLKFADIMVVEPREELAFNGIDLTVNRINTVHHQQAEINGEGLTVSVKERRFDTTDIDFRGRYLTSSLASDQQTAHASIIATTIAGGGNSFYTGKGAAWGSALTSSDFIHPLPDPVSAYQQYQISVQNHAYGVDPQNYYGAEAVAYDASTYELPYLLHVFSAGNEGNNASESGDYGSIAGFANLTGNVKHAKNILTVGASLDHGELNSLSSRGPAYDGRIKPELLAFSREGSSGAAALVSGTSLLLQQLYSQQHKDSLPPASLIKALLINGATDIGPQGLDYYSGFGQLHATNSIDILQNGNYIIKEIAQGETQSLDLDIPPDTRLLSITISWTDPAAEAHALQALVNDLDLELIAPDGKKYLPWTLSGNADSSSILATAIRKVDSLNNVEKITLDHPEGGVYRIQINGKKVKGRQAYSCVFQWQKANTFSWTFPTSSHPLIAGEENIIRWDSYFDAMKGKLSCSYDLGQTWHLIDEDLDLETGYFSWTPPDTHVQAILRQEVDGAVHTSDTFWISKIARLSVGFNCEDSVLVQWNPISGADSYMLWGVGEKYLEAIQTVSDTFAIIQKQQYEELYVAVSPQSASGASTQRSFAIDYSKQGTACYIKNFRIDPEEGGQAFIQIKLGSLYHLKRLSIEQSDGFKFVPIQTFEAIDRFEFTYTAKNLIQGTNHFRLHLELENGASIFSERELVLSTGAQAFIWLPNPVKLSSGETVLMSRSVPEQGQVQILDIQGRLIHTQEVLDIFTPVYVDTWPVGVYYFRVLDSKRMIGGGKLWINP